MILYNACDHRYLHYTKAMVSSALKYNPGLRTFLHFVNVTDAGNQSDENGIILSEQRKFVSEPGRLDYIANVRAYDIKEILHLLKDGELLLYLDSDSIVTAPLDHLVKLMDNHHFGTYETAFNEEEYNKFLVSTMIFKKCEETLDFVDIWCEKLDVIKKTGIRSIMNVQKAYKRAMDVMRSHVEFLDVGQRYCDHLFKDNSPIWCGRGSRKRVNVKFRKKLHEYLQQFEEV